MTTKEMLIKWNKGEEIESVEMGGIGDGYENAIQQNIFPLCEKIADNPVMKETDEKKIEKIINKILLEQSRDQDLSGAQAGAIKNVAYQFAKYGYQYMMDKAPKDRIIKVTKED